jgi:uncharacterized alpha-E superfamily protein
MLSRVADNLYWMSRYLERAEHSARLIATHLNLMLDVSADSSDQRWRRVLACHRAIRRLRRHRARPKSLRR